MIKRLTTAFHKLAFCYRVSADANSFLRLIINTKKYARRKNRNYKDGNPVPYNLILNGKRKIVYLRTYAGDIDIFYEVWWKMVYTDPGVIWTAAPKTIIDLGANIGITALFFSLQFTEAGIYAVEPDGDNFELLTNNLADEILDSRLIPVHAAILPGNGIAYIQKKDKAYNSTVSSDVLSGAAVRSLNMHTLLREMLITEIDLLKIDIEGWEEQLFSGNNDWLDMVNTVVMECHSGPIKTHCEQLLQSKGFLLMPQNKHSSGLLWAVKKNRAAK